MAYADLSDLIERAGETEIGQVADRDLDGTPDPDVIAAALTHADNVVNGFLAARHSLPLSSVPALVNTWAVAIARYYLHREGPPDYVAADYKDAMAALRDVARGTIVLSIGPGDVVEQSGGGHLAAIPDEVFSPAKLRGWS